MKLSIGLCVAALSMFAVVGCDKVPLPDWGSGDHQDDKCSPGDTRPADVCGNTCSCSEGQWACTLVACDVNECKPGDVDKCADGCNTRHCQSDGTWGGCTEIACDPSPVAECDEDADCVVTGCSSHVCAAEPVATTCEYREEYACYQKAHCGCSAGACGWEITAELKECLGK